MGYTIWRVTREIAMDRDRWPKPEGSGKKLFVLYWDDEYYIGTWRALEQFALRESARFHNGFVSGWTQPDIAELTDETIQKALERGAEYLRRLLAPKPVVKPGAPVEVEYYAG